jgi:transposase
MAWEIEWHAEVRTHASIRIIMQGRGGHRWLPVDRFDALCSRPARRYVRRMTTDTPLNNASTGQPSAVIIPLPGMTKRDKRRSEDKWTAQVMKLGFTPLPNLLLRAQARLGLNPEQLNALLQIIEHWWEADKMPFPSKDTLARRMGKSPRQIQRYLTQLEDGGFISRIERFNGRKAQVSNGYDLGGLVAKLVAIEPAFQKIAEQYRLRRKKVETASGGGA